MADNEPEKVYNAWPEDFPEVTSLVSYSALRHSTDPEIKALYDRAKNREDREAAAELIDRLVTDEGVEKIKAIAARNPQAVVVSVHAVEGSGKNKIPQVLAEFIGMHGSLEVDNNIVQTSIVGNTGQNTWRRLAHRAAFEGSIRPGKDYILVDDVFSAGGTFSELRHFIETNGGNVMDTITMANGAKSLNAQLSVTRQHILELERKFGIKSLQRFLEEEHLYGGNYQALTDAEARTLLGAKTLDEARDRIAEARQERDRGIRPEVVPGTSPDAESLNTQNTDHTTHLSPVPALPRQMSYRETLDTLKNTYIDAVSRYGIKSDEAAQTYKTYKEYELVEKFDPRGVRLGRYDKDDGQAARMIAAVQTSLDREQKQREKLIPKPVPPEAEKDTMDGLFKYVLENGRYQYLETEREIAGGHGEYYFTDIHTLHTAADLMADKLFADDIRRQQIDLSSSPFWATVWSDAEAGATEHIIPIKNGNDLISMYDNLYDRYGVSGHEIDIYGIYQDIASYEAEQNIQKETDMSDEYSENEEMEAEAQTESFEEQPAEQEAPREAEGLGQEPKAQLSPDEIAFRTALKMRTQVAESLQNGSLPCLPGADGIADTKPAVNLVTGTRYHGANLLYLKDFQKRNGFPTAEYATQDAIQKSGIPIRAGESGVMISFAEQNKQTGEWENKNVRLFNVAQTARPWEFKAYAEKLGQEKEQKQEAFFKSQFGDAYKPWEKAEQKPGPDITCSSTEPERYLSQYLAAVSMGSAFKATSQQATEFSQKLNNRLYAPMENGFPDPFKLSKICKEAGVQCKEIIKEIKQPQHKQEQTQQHSRHM